MMMLAFTGNMAALTELLKNRFRDLRADTKEFWIATCELAAGANEAGRARLLLLQRRTKDALVRSDIAQRLNEQPDRRAVLNPASAATVRRFETNLTTRRRSLLAPQSGRLTPVVATFIGLNLAMFLVELALGGSTNYFTLHRLGALEPIAVLARGEYWRLLGALFLHYGALHLLVNLYALYVLGPPLEASIGGVRFAACYLVAGLGSSTGVVALWRLGWTRADLLVGASGAVMGIVGAWAGFLLQHHHLPMVRQRLLNIAAIVVMQTAFDYFTPQVSMAAHLCGVASGFVIALLIIPRDAA
jgi:rhomboid protease GluP